MAHKIYKTIIELIVKAFIMAKEAGINNLLQPGLVKEMIIADLLGHDLITSKRDADAQDPNDESVLYEYLSCKEGGSGQIDRVFKEPSTKRQKSLDRIRRNNKIYFAVFYADNQIKVKVIYELCPEVVLQETERQIDNSKNAISHVGFSERWAKENGKIVYTDGA